MTDKCFCCDMEEKEENLNLCTECWNYFCDDCFDDDCDICNDCYDALPECEKCGEKIFTSSDDICDDCKIEMEMDDNG